MKILNVVRFFPKISETFVLDQIVGQIKHGYKVKIAAISNPHKNQALEDRTLESHQHSEILKYNLTETTSYFTDGNLENIIVEFNPDIIHIHFGDLAPKIIQNTHNIKSPLVISFYGITMPQKSETRSLSSADYLDTFSKARLITAHCNKWVHSLVNMGANKNITRLFRVGVNLSNYSKKNSYQLSDPPEILAIGRLVEKKGFEYLIRAVKNVHDKNVRIHTTVVGDGILFDSLNMLTNRLGISHIFTFTGKLDRDQVTKHLASSDIFIAPSVTAADGDEEGIPTTLMEACASSLPIITTNHGGIPELFNASNSLIVQEKDHNGISDSIIKLINSIELRQKLGENAKKLALDNFDQSKLLPQLFKWYEEIQ